MRPLVSDEALAALGTWLTGWPLALLCWGVVVYAVVMRMRW